MRVGRKAKSEVPDLELLWTLAEMLMIRVFEYQKNPEAVTADESKLAILRRMENMYDQLVLLPLDKASLQEELRMKFRGLKTLYRQIRFGEIDTAGAQITIRKIFAGYPERESKCFLIGLGEIANMGGPSNAAKTMLGRKCGYGSIRSVEKQLQKQNEPHLFESEFLMEVFRRIFDGRGLEEGGDSPSQD